ncbi:MULTISPECIES: cupin domain-containing protein [unclassified Oceanobacter]|jgi:ethanolamine utilization protein EutQ (cupin superfamily)|uniref:cupin domain-containing protein n=1 Tax=unclassified Oceanobacter TaxID=2620260 RepID=UPI0026E3E2DD|nr:MULTISPECIES: cupin domain-containing protein [unclassified Oceanobacter]MDO6682109.1 hypothetical protein [Oceanobacter sp. 5_MG-2023]MDP2505495.1 hypothetical protein [Oceanobacter sp. 3_MG-2023]MDP2548640.1 hypothetical protein [Oceanobacter sp. 4_MG-2023]MDP2610276.1 hypothetical protein [Oceanobacter sp. 1_MG-2023]MDP2613586.1 hypothetical protein [Oceanobacter sp. 2_MG-2023]
MSMTHFSQAIKTPQAGISRPGIHTWLQGVSQLDDTDKARLDGCSRMEKSDEPLVCEYTDHEMKIIVEGGMVISDETGYRVEAKVGDVFYFEKGSIITFNPPSDGTGCFFGQRREGGG